MTVLPRNSPDLREAAPDSGDVSLVWLITVLLRRLRMLATAAGLGATLAVAFALLRPATYTTAFSFIPQTGQDANRGGLASLAGQFGIQLGALAGSAPPPQLYAELLRNREVLGTVASATVPVENSRVERLADFLDAADPDSMVAIEQTVRTLRERVVSTSVAARTTGAVNVVVKTRSADASLRIAELLLEGLNEYNRTTRQSQAAAERKFTEGRLSEARVALRAAEDDLEHFLRTNRVAGSPELRFEQERLQRELSLQEQVVTGLAQQFEDARIREVRDTPVITLIERPTRAVLRDPRRAVRSALVGAVAVGILALAYALALAAWERGARNSEERVARAALQDEWARLTGRSRSPQ